MGIIPAIPPTILNLVKERTTAPISIRVAIIISAIVEFETIFVFIILFFYMVFFIRFLIKLFNSMYKELPASKEKRITTSK